MIPVKDSLTHIDNLPGEEIAFGIGNAKWVMKANARLYSDITTSIIREYSTNAHDANVMAGNLDPIEVTLPSVMSPHFIVEDKGVGMSVDDFKNIYTQFGTSNKRERNDVNGTLGFGSKSGIAYTTQFSVTSVKDGVKSHGVVMRKPDWEIVLKVVSTVRTSEPNGTRISIPVHNVGEFVDKARAFYKFWLPGTVNVNGAPVVHDVGEKITDNFYLCNQWNTSYVVMNNVAYRINNPAALFQNTGISGINFVAYVDGGDVEFTPSREDLDYSEHTKNALHKIANDIADEIITTAKAEIDDSLAHADAFVAWYKWTSLLGRGMFKDLEFRGDPFNSEFAIKGKSFYNTANTAAVSIREWNVEAMPRTMIVTDYDYTLNSKHKAMAKEYVALKGWNNSYIIFTPMTNDDIESVWIPRDRFVTYDEMRNALPKKTKLTVSSYGRVAGSWDYHTRAKFVKEKTIPDIKHENLYYITTRMNNRTKVRTILATLKDDNAVVVVVPANRLNKFRRDYPFITDFITYLESKVVKDAATLLTDNAKSVLDLEVSHVRSLGLDASKIDDPEFTHVFTEDDSYDLYQQNLSFARQCNIICTKYKPKTDNFLQKYPLCSNISTFRKINDDIYFYINAKYASLKEANND